MTRSRHHIDGKDRITKALVRKNGKLVETPLKEALDLVASKMQETIKSHGKDSVAMYGSGQWSITDGYVASKLFKGCIGTNNLEANARLCMASAAARNGSAASVVQHSSFSGQLCLRTDTGHK